MVLGMMRGDPSDLLVKTVDDNKNLFFRGRRKDLIDCPFGIELTD